jgi:hypothetical protein
MTELIEHTVIEGLSWFARAHQWIGDHRETGDLEHQLRSWRRDRDLSAAQRSERDPSPAPPNSDAEGR